MQLSNSLAVLIILQRGEKVKRDIWNFNDNFIIKKCMGKECSV